MSLRKEKRETLECENTCDTWKLLLTCDSRSALSCCSSHRREEQQESGLSTCLSIYLLVSSSSSTSPPHQVSARASFPGGLGGG